MREIVLDTETTGFEPSEGHRIVEIGCVELKHHVPTGNNYQVYINPERDMPEDAEKVHGLSAEFLSDKPVFADVADDFRSFVSDDPVVIHNASFDLKFLNYELRQLDRQPIQPEQSVDTLLIARRKYPGAPASLDALCKRFQIDATERTVHGALLDAELLAQVYLELIGGAQPGLSFTDTKDGSVGGSGPAQVARNPRPRPLPSLLTAEEEAAHKAFLEALPGEAFWTAKS